MQSSMCFMFPVQLKKQTHVCAWRGGGLSWVVSLQAVLSENKCLKEVQNHLEPLGWHMALVSLCHGAASCDAHRPWSQIPQTAAVPGEGAGPANPGASMRRLPQSGCVTRSPESQDQSSRTAQGHVPQVGPCAAPGAT